MLSLECWALIRYLVAEDFRVFACSEFGVEGSNVCFFCFSLSLA